MMMMKLQIFLPPEMEVLEQMVDMTSKLFECDRDEMYSYLLRLCSKSLFYLLWLGTPSRIAWRRCSGADCQPITNSCLD